MKNGTHDEMYYFEVSNGSVYNENASYDSSDDDSDDNDSNDDYSTLGQPTNKFLREIIRRCLKMSKIMLKE